MMQSTSSMTAALPRWRRSAFSAFIERHFKWVIVLPAVLLILVLSIYPLLRPFRLIRKYVWPF